jgi:adenosylhomocysteine nucleosidase
MNPAALTLVAFAVKEEAKFFKPLASTRSNVEILLTGMGSPNAEKALRGFLKNRRPGLVVSAGFAGGLKPGLASGTVLFSNPEDEGLARALAAAGSQSARFHFARRVATQAQEKKRLYEQTEADAVEMESQTIGAVCREHGIPSVTVRVVLDTVDEDLPLDFNQLLTPDERMDMGKLALALVKRPGKIPSLLRLREQSDTAAKRLAEVLGRVWLQGA